MGLKLVKTDLKQRTMGLCKELSSALYDMSMNQLKYGGKAVAYYFESNDFEFRIILDETGEFKSRQGIHVNGRMTDLEHLLDQVNCASRDLFDTIWIHV